MNATSPLASAATIGNGSFLLEATAHIPTPALVVDGPGARRNIQRMASYVAEHGLGLRPHIKTHKNKAMARMQMEAGAIGVTVAKVGEAEVMAEVTEDILMAYPAVDRVRCNRLAALARTRLVRVSVDTLAAVEALGAAAAAAGTSIGILIEVDAGFGRTGVGTPAEALKLAQFAASTKGLRLDGMLCFPGQIREPAAQQQSPLALVSGLLDETIALWSRHGLESKIVAGGTTPTAYQSHHVKAYTEIHPGTYVFNDLNTLRSGNCTMEECTARIVCTVVSDAVKNQVIIDGGTKTLTSDLCIAARDSGHGFIVEYPNAKIKRCSEEHGQVDVSLCDRRPKIGERVTIIPNHICPCVNLQDAFWWAEPGEGVRRMSVDARGMLS